jgi:1-acyl-sn-glycerol-3-phosphate acyltransferase
MNTFEEIRPYNNEELHDALLELTTDPSFGKIVSMLYPNHGEKDHIFQMLLKMDTIKDFQDNIIYPLLVKIEEASTDGLTFSAMDQFNANERYLFISNHRDIILDSAFLNAIMHQSGFMKTEIAIGDNLLIYNWIKKLVRINRCFIVKRNLGLRKQLEASKELSSYIRYSVTKKGQSIWLAQREGRTKNGDDQTQAALLKMLNMSNNESLTEGFKKLNIVPMAISYEIEPCGISKVEELLNRKYNPDFTKSQQDDLHSMANGFMQAKGRVHFSFGNPLNLKIEELTSHKNYNENIQSIAEYIDRRIYFNYKLWPNNYIASDLLSKSNKNQKQYTEEQKTIFVNRMQKECATLHFDKDEAIEMYLEMYAKPVINYERQFE